MDKKLKKKILDIIYKEGQWSFEGVYIGKGEIEVQAYYLENENEVVKELIKVITGRLIK